MAQFGFTQFSELNGPTELVDQAQAAEEAGFDAVAMSDHTSPMAGQPHRQRVRVEHAGRRR